MGNIGLGAAIGLVFGIAAILWIEPDNAGGSALLVVFCTAMTVIIGAVIGFIRKR